MTHSETALPSAALSIVGRYAGEQVEVTGDREAIAALAALLSTAAQARVPLRVPEGTAEPYEGFLRSIAVRPAEGLILIVREGDVLTLRGVAERLQFLGECIETLIGDLGGEHLHIEYYDEHPYLLPESLALVVRLVSPGGA